MTGKCQRREGENDELRGIEKRERVFKITRMECVNLLKCKFVAVRHYVELRILDLYTK